MDDGESRSVPTIVKSGKEQRHDIIEGSQIAQGGLGRGRHHGVDERDGDRVHADSHSGARKICRW